MDLTADTTPGAPRLRLGVLPTPLVAADRWRAALGCGPVWIKRDDLAGFGVAGNKTRALEHLLGEAVAEGADVLVTGGGPDSNFVPAAALAARVAGLACELLVRGSGDAAQRSSTMEDGARAATPNLALATAAGATVRGLGDAPRERVDTAVEERAVALRAAGRRPVAVPRGGSTPLGAVGFVRAAAELLDQCTARLGAAPPVVVLPVGSGGSAAGLLVGLAAAGAPTRVLGASVSRPPDEITEKVLGLARSCATRLGAAPPEPDRLEIVDRRGPGFGVAGPADRRAAALALRTEGLLLDDTYGAKAFALAAERTGPEPVVLWHTGGVVSALAHLGEDPTDEHGTDPWTDHRRPRAPEGAR